MKDKKIQACDRRIKKSLKNANNFISKEEPELGAVAIASCNKKAKVSPKSFASDAYKTTLQAVNALKQIAKELKKINKMADGL